MRKVLPLSLVLILATFGCTMNRTPGNGQPVSATPSRSPAATPGSSSGNVPMASSYTVPTTNTRLSADEAAAIMRDHQAYNGRFLGYLNPTPVIQQPAQQFATGLSPSQYTAPQPTVPQLTVSSSLSTAPTAVVPSAPATVTPGTFAATGFGTLTPTPTVIPASTPNAAPITISNSDGQIVVSNVKSN